MAGLLSIEDQDRINNDGLMGLGMGLLSASGPSQVPISLGQALGMGAAGMQQSRQQAEMMAYKKKMMEQEAQQHAFQQQLMQMQLAEAQRQNQIRTNAGEYMKGLDPEAQQYAAATGDFKGAFELHRQKQFSNLVGGAMGGQQQEAPRPFQDQVKPGQFQVTDENQANTLIADLKKLEAVNPQEAAKVRESLVQQGLIRPPMQKIQPDVDTLARLGALGSMQGIKGADKLIEYAKFSKPEWATLDSGNALYGYNKNSQNNPFGNSPIVKQMSPDAVASNALGRDRLDFDRSQAVKPQYKDGVWVTPPSENQPAGNVIETPLYSPPKGSAKANVISSEKVVSLLDQAEKLLDTSTGSYIGTARDAAYGAFGGSTKGAQSAAQLKALEGAIMMAQPRMEGPQSDKDVAMYRQMAGQIGDSTIPIETRKAALDGIRELHRQYAISPVKYPSVSNGGWSVTIVK